MYFVSLESALSQSLRRRIQSLATGSPVPSRQALRIEYHDRLKTCMESWQNTKHAVRYREMMSKFSLFSKLEIKKEVDLSVLVKHFDS